ncbi:MAG: Uma2 family endonuclease [Deltaproteobacteria bacterium]|nr:Uma2 family endonuclease [Deltaproteobacteria bacterium]
MARRRRLRHGYGTLEHGQLSAAVIGELRGPASGCGCRVFSPTRRCACRPPGWRRTPTLSVVCGPIERDADDRNAMANPAVLVEVLSDGTEAYDRGEKFEHYR